MTKEHAHERHPSKDYRPSREHSSRELPSNDDERPSSDHPLEHHPSFRAVIAAAPPLAELAAHVQGAGELVGTLAIACGDLAEGFAAPPASRKRLAAHHRAWLAVRRIDRAVTAARRRRLASAEVVQRAQRAIDRADVLIHALLPT
jgi:hypothetical protein